MLTNPRLGQAVQVWYRADIRGYMPHHGALGVIRGVGRGRPRNHLVEVGGVGVIVPAGNLRPISEGTK